MKQKLKLINFKDQEPKFIDVIIEKSKPDVLHQNLKLTYTFGQKDIDSNIFFPKSIKNLEKGFELWKKTCLECFFFDEKSDQYFEVNVSPEGKYDLMSFKSYRQKTNKEAPIQVSDLTIKKSQSLITVSFHLKTEFSSLYSISPTVILDTPAEQLFFAQKHIKTRPDFHLKKP